jgi:glutaconate CoA-transferase, subunit A
LPFLPVLGFTGTDYERIRPDFRKVVDPYSGREIFVVPSIRPDWAVVHAVRADETGNAICSALEADRLAILAARRTVVTVEEVVSPDAFAARPGEVFLSSLHIDMIVVAPFGAHPGACLNAYGIDRAHVERYMALSRTEEGFASYLAEYVLGKTEDDYRIMTCPAGRPAGGKRV